MAEFKINVTADATAAVAGAQQTTQGFEKTASAVHKAGDEAERYQAALEKMAAAQAEQQKAAGAQNERESESEKRASAFTRLEESKKRIAQVNKEVQESVIQVTEADIKAMGESEEATKKAFFSKRDLKSAVKGLKEEFPALAHLAKLALNPIAFTVAGITAAFVIWRTRVDELTRTLGGVELPESYGKLGLKQDEELKKQLLRAKETRAANLELSAARKLDEAKGIKAGGPEEEAKLLEKHRKLAEAAQKDMEERQTRKGELVDYMGGDMGFLARQAFAYKFRMRYEDLSLDQAKALEDKQISTDQAIIDSYNRFQGSMAPRGERRKRREQLTTEADHLSSCGNNIEMKTQ